MLNRKRRTGPVSARRRALRLGNVNAMLWSMGNSLTTGTLILLLAYELNADDVWISLLLAAPALIGMLRIATPWFIRLLGSKRSTCLWFYGISYSLLLGVPLLAMFSDLLPSDRDALMAIVAVLSLHQLLEHIGSVSLWSWLDDLIPPPIRGRYLGQRQMLQLLVLIPLIAWVGFITEFWKDGFLPNKVLFGIPVLIGACLLGAAVVPLYAMPATLGLQGRRRELPRAAAAWRKDTGRAERVSPAGASSTRSSSSDAATSSASSAWAAVKATIWAPLQTRPYRRLVMFGCWLGMANGLTQTAQSRFPFRELGLGFLSLELMRTTMRFGQMGLSPVAGRWSDRIGSVPAMVLCQAIVALGPLFYVASSAEFPWWLLGAWVAWSAYAGINLGLNNLMLKLAPPGQSASCVAGYLAWSSLAYAVMTICGGILFDELRWMQRVKLGPWELDPYRYYFVIGFILRMTAIIFLLAIVEPGAWSIRRVLERIGIVREKSLETAPLSPFSRADD